MGKREGDLQTRVKMDAARKDFTERSEDQQKLKMNRRPAQSLW